MMDATAVLSTLCLGLCVSQQSPVDSAAYIEKQKSKETFEQGAKK
jgi:hypothetical protein